MPANLLEALFYIYLLFPGLAYVIARESHRPRANRSTFRETATVVLVSVLCVGSAFVVAVLLALVHDGVRSWLRTLVLDSPQLIRSDSQLFFLVLIGALLIATSLGWILGGKAVYDFTHRLQDPNYGHRKRIDREHTTWQTLLTAKKGCWTHVTVKLKSGAMVEGKLYSYSGAIESAEWALTLEPLTYIDSSGNEESISYSLIFFRAVDVEFVAVGYIRDRSPVALIDGSPSRHRNWTVNSSRMLLRWLRGQQPPRET